MWWDLVVALVLMVISANGSGLRDGIGIALCLVVGGATLWRRRTPQRALAVALGGVIVIALLTPLTDLDLPWVYPMVWLLVFNVGLRHGDRGLIRMAVVVAVTGLAAFVAPADSTSGMPDRVYSSFAVAAMCATAFLGGVHIHLQRRRVSEQREHAARAAVAAERSRITRELHDIIGHNLSVMISLATGGVVAVQNAPRDAERAFEAIGNAGRASMHEMRHVLEVLRFDESPAGAPLTPNLGIGGVDDLVESVRGAGLRVRLERVGSLDDISGGIQLAVYRIVQEALTNTLRYAGESAQVSVSIERDDLQVLVRVEDSNAAPVQVCHSGPGSGQGIVGMRGRAEAFGGTLAAGPTAFGWRVVASIPISGHREWSDRHGGGGV